jgi:hypothetical protein
VSVAADVDTVTYALTHPQWDAIGRLQCPITAVTLHSFSGAATVKLGDKTMACVQQDGYVSYAHQYADGSYASPSYRGFLG